MVAALARGHGFNNAARTTLGPPSAMQQRDRICVLHRSGRTLQRDPKREHAAPAQARTVGLHGSAVRACNAACDEEPESGSGVLASDGSVHLREWLEELAKAPGRQADPAVL